MSIDRIRRVREWLAGGSRPLIVAVILTGLMTIAVVVAAGGGSGATDPVALVSPTSTSLALPDSTTTIEAVTTTTGGSTTTTTTGGTTATTTTGGTTATTTTGGTTAPTTPSPTTTVSEPDNQAPLIVDPGVSSTGMLLEVKPEVSDPDGDDFDVGITVDGVPRQVTSGVEAFSVRFDPAEVGYEHTATVLVEVTDTAGNQTTETILHDVAHLRTVSISDITFKLTGASCLDTHDTVRMRFNIEHSGVVNNHAKVSWGVHAGTEWALNYSVEDHLEGRPVAQTITFTGEWDGEADSFTKAHTRSDQVLTNFFSLTECRIQVTYRVEVTDQ